MDVLREGLNRLQLLGVRERLLISGLDLVLYKLLKLVLRGESTYAMR